MNDLTRLQPGDLIAIPNRNRDWTNKPTIRHHIYRISKRTTTQAEATNIHATHMSVKVRVSDGKLVGQNYVYAIEATPDLMAQHNKEVAALKRHNAARDRLSDLGGKHLHQLKLSAEQMEVLADAWERVKAMGQGSQG